MELGRRLRDDPHATDDEIKLWLGEQPFFDPDHAYASVLDTAFPSEQERAAYFDELIAGKMPTSAHSYIAELVNQGYVSQVLTTNFDRLMEYAVLQTCQHFPCLILNDELPKQVDTQSRRAKILKLHGDYLYRNIRNLDRELDLAKANMRQKMELAVHDRVLIVAGYSGNDDSVMDVLQSLANTKTAFAGGLFWLVPRGSSLNRRVTQLLAATHDRRSGVVEIDDSDAFFGGFVNALPENSHVRFPALGADAHKIALKEEEVDQFVQERTTDDLRTCEFGVLLRQSPFAEFCQFPAALDYTLARYEELGQIPENLGEFVDRYVDLLGSIVSPTSNENETGKFQHRVGQLLRLNLATKREDKITSDDSFIDDYLSALRLCDVEMDDDQFIKMLAEDKSYDALRFYVGLIEDATPLIQRALNQIVTAPLFYGRLRPWPEAFYSAAALVGDAAEVNQALVERIVDLLLVELEYVRGPTKWVVWALASLGSRGINPLVECLLDSLHDVFGREDLAYALGAIGTQDVVLRLQQASENLSPRDTKMVVFALGQTRNPRAIPVIQQLAENVAPAYHQLLSAALQQVGYQGAAVLARGPDEGPLPRPELSARDLVHAHCPEFESSQCAVLQKLYQQLPEMTLRAMKAEGWPPDMRGLIQTGQRLRNAGKLWEAESLLTECLRRYPMAYHCYHDLAIVYARQHRTLAARRCFSLGFILNPESSDYYNDFALTLMDLKNVEAARYVLMSAFGLDLRNYRPWLTLGLVNLARTFDWEPIQDAQEKPGGGVIHNYEFEWSGPVKDLNGLFEARTCFQQVLVLNPNHAAAAQYLAMVCKTIGAPASQQPTRYDLRSVLHLGELTPCEYSETELPAAAVDAHNRYRRLRGDQDLEGALVAIDEAIAACPRSTALLHNKAHLLAHMGRIDESIQVQEMALARTPWKRDLLLNYTQFLSSAGRHQEAIAASEKVIRIEPTSPIGWLSLARKYIAAGDQARARDSLRQVVRLSGPWSWPLLQAQFEGLFETLDVHALVW